MTAGDPRALAGAGARAAEGWVLERLTPPSRLHGANGIRAHADGRIYVAQVPGSQVSAIDVDSGAIETISPMGGAIVAPDDLVFDEAGNLYLTEITEGRVTMLAPDGRTRVIRGDMPVANPITWHQGRLIAGECRIGARIMELDRDGGAPRVILDDVPMANAFDVGPDGKLYVPVMAANAIWRVDLGGGAPEVVAGDLGVPDSVKFHPDGYIVSTQVASGEVLKIDPRTGAREVLATPGPGLDNVAFIGRRTFVSSIPGEITEILGNGETRSIVPRALQWPLGLAVGAEGTLLVADGMFAYHLRPGGAPELAGMGFYPGFPGFVRGVAAERPGVWLVTTGLGQVSRYRPATSESEVLASGYDQLMGVAAAPDGAVFAEHGGGRVLAVRGGAIEELASGLDGPMGVALSGGDVLVAEAGAGRVVRLAGGRAETVIDGLAAPHGLAVLGDTLFVVETRGRRLIACDLGGGDRRVIAHDLPVGPPPGVVPKFLGPVGDMAGPMTAFAGLAAGADGTLYLSADAEGSVIAIRPDARR